MEKIDMMSHFQFKDLTNDLEELVSGLNFSPIYEKKLNPIFSRSR